MLAMFSCYIVLCFRIVFRYYSVVCRVVLIFQKIRYDMIKVRIQNRIMLYRVVPNHSRYKFRILMLTFFYLKY
jgi:hypothetical protein